MIRPGTPLQRKQPIGTILEWRHCAWRETDEQDTDRETVLRDIISGQYAFPLSHSMPSRAGLAMLLRTSPMRSPRALLVKLDLSPALEAAFDQRYEAPTRAAGPTAPRQRLKHAYSPTFLAAVINSLCALWHTATMSVQDACTSSVRLKILN